MKRYMLFAGETYYGRGGVHDLIKSNDDLEFLTDQAKNLEGNYILDSRHIQWWHIYDTETEKIVAATSSQAYPNE